MHRGGLTSFTATDAHEDPDRRAGGPLCPLQIYYGAAPERPHPQHRADAGATGHSDARGRDPPTL
jgi:hypothetical protein